MYARLDPKGKSRRWEVIAHICLFSCIPDRLYRIRWNVGWPGSHYEHQCCSWLNHYVQALKSCTISPCRPITVHFYTRNKKPFNSLQRFHDLHIHHIVLFRWFCIQDRPNGLFKTRLSRSNWCRAMVLISPLSGNPRVCICSQSVDAQKVVEMTELYKASGKLFGIPSNGSIEKLLWTHLLQEYRWCKVGISFFTPTE